MKPFWDHSVAAWVDDQLEHAGPFTGCQAMGVEHKGETVAGFVFHNWDPRNGLIEVSGASTHPRWATREVLNEGLNYVFDTCGCQMLLARQDVNNTEPREVWTKLGAFETYVPRLLGRDTVGTILWLTDDAWRASKFYRG